MKWYDVIMLCVAIVGVTLSAAAENWVAMIWAISTALWVVNASLRSK